MSPVTSPALPRSPPFGLHWVPGCCICAPKWTARQSIAAPLAIALTCCCSLLVSLAVFESLPLMVQGLQSHLHTSLSTPPSTPPQLPSSHRLAVFPALRFTSYSSSGTHFRLLVFFIQNFGPFSAFLGSPPRRVCEEPKFSGV